MGISKEMHIYVATRKKTIHSQTSSPKSFIRSNCRVVIYSRSANHCDSYFRPIRIHPFKRCAQVAQKPFIQTIIIHSSTWNVSIASFCLCASPPLAYSEKYACRTSPWWQESSCSVHSPSPLHLLDSRLSHNADPPRTRRCLVITRSLHCSAHLELHNSSSTSHSFQCTAFLNARAWHGTECPRRNLKDANLHEYTTAY
jgi:hypothetical protein